MTTTARQANADRMSEADLVDAIVKRARLFGYLVCHFRPARTADGRWVTPVQGDKGFPDLIIAGKGKVLIVETKRETGSLSREQRQWIAALAGGDVDVRIWFPHHWVSGEIDEVLS